MARMKSICTIETELRKAEADLKKAQEKVDAFSQRVLQLQQQKQEYETRQIITAYKKSEELTNKLSLDSAKFCCHNENKETKKIVAHISLLSA